MTDVKVGNLLLWQAADTTGIVGALHVLGFAWLSTGNASRDIAADDVAEVTDQDGNVLFEKKAISNGDGIDPVSFGFPGLPLNGILVPQLDGGELFVWVNQSVYDQS